MSKTIEEEIIESINEWPVSENVPDYTSSTDKIDNPSSVSSFFLRNVGKSKQGKKITSCKKPDDIEDEVLVDIALARWWRKKGKHMMVDLDNIPKSDNPNTIINFASSTEEGMEFIRNEIRRLRDKIASGIGHHNIHSALASFYEKAGNLSLAKMHLETAVDKAPDDKEYQWRMCRLKRMIRIRQDQETALVKLNISSMSQLTVPLSKQVRRISAEHLSFKEFFYSYALTSTPIIITGMVVKMTTVPWTLSHIADVAGDLTVTLKKSVKDSVQWTRLEDSKTVNIKDFVDGLHGNKSQENVYLFDWNIPIHCPELAKELTIPKYFAGDFLQRTSQGSYYQDSWPSLFIAPGGVTSELHVDAFGSNFWMALFEGRKRWVFYGRNDTAMLYPTYGHPWSTDPVFQVDLEHPDTKYYPLLSEAQPIECVLEPGELLFVPAGCPHRVENLEPSLAISGNYVDLSNIDLVTEELAMTALIDQRSEELVKQLTDPDFKSNMCSEIEDLTWKHFKSWTPTQNYNNFDITPEIVHNKLAEMNADKT